MKMYGEDTNIISNIDEKETHAQEATGLPFQEP